MEQAILLAVVASFFTATASVCQRLGAKENGVVTGLDINIVFRLAHRPIWLLGLVSMMFGFAFQVSALHFGDLALVQPILATELLFVFAYMSVIGSRRVKRRDWLAAAAMASGLGLFLLAAAPSGGRLHAPAYLWWLAGAATFGAVALLLAVAFGWGRRPDPPRSRRAAILGVATGISWGFVAAVIKEMSSRLNGGFVAITSNWSLYVLIGAGALSLLLSTHALSAGPLAASQPGFTIVDPLTASLLGLFLFDEHIQVGVLALTFQAMALALLVSGVSVLSHSQLVVGDDELAETATVATPPEERVVAMPGGPGRTPGPPPDERGAGRPGGAVSAERGDRRSATEVYPAPTVRAGQVRVRRRELRATVRPSSR